MRVWLRVRVANRLVASPTWRFSFFYCVLLLLLLSPHLTAPRPNAKQLRHPCGSPLALASCLPLPPTPLCPPGSHAPTQAFLQSAKASRHTMFSVIASRCSTAQHSTTQRRVPVCHPPQRHRRTTTDPLPLPARATMRSSRSLDPCKRLPPSPLNRRLTAPAERTPGALGTS